MAAIFFVIAIIAAIVRSGGFATGAAEIAKAFFFVFILLFVTSLIKGLMRAGSYSALARLPDPDVV